MSAFRSFVLIAFLTVSCTAPASQTTPAAGGAAPAASNATTAPTPTPDDFPSKTMTFVVSTTPGSSIDLTNRKLAQLLGETFKQTIIVENKSAGDGADALNYLQTRPADGYTWSGWTSTLAAVLAQGVVPYTAKDFTYVGQLMSSPFAIMAKTGRYKDLAAFVAAAKASPSKIRVAGGSASVLAAVKKFEQATGVSLTYVPFSGGSEVKRALLGGDVELSSGTADTTAGIQTLALLAENRLPALPNLPAISEFGYKGVNATTWRGVVGKAGVPAGRVATMRDAIRKVVATPAWKDFVKGLEAGEVVLLDDSFQQVVEKEIVELRPLLKQ